MKRDLKTKPFSDDILCAEYEAVYHYVLSLCRNEQDAKDITQATFEKALKKRSDYAGQSSLFSWLCAIAKNHWIDSFRKSGRETPEDMDAEPGLEVKKYGSVEDDVINRQMLYDVMAALDDMEEPYREVFMLRFFGQATFADISALYGKTESWSRVTFHRARLKLRETLEKDEWL